MFGRDLFNTSLNLEDLFKENEEETSDKEKNNDDKK